MTDLLAHLQNDLLPCDATQSAVLLREVARQSFNL